MDFTPFYELRDRLRAGIIAGSTLISEDFRLKRALDELAPLEKAAPVFSKLGQFVRTLIAPDCPDRTGPLLEALSLADAILCTQGAVAASSAPAPLPEQFRGHPLTNAPYSILSPLIEALTTSGNGKYSFVTDTHQTRPEVFSDYRVQEAMIKALGAGYAELADQVQNWLVQEGERVLPMLIDGFDPRGKKDMVRRVRAIEEIAGANANSFYLEQLPKAEKEVRAALIYALRHNPQNSQRIVELCYTEKGNAKKSAHWALARMDTPEAQAYWEALVPKKPMQAAKYMALSETGYASRITAQAVQTWMDLGFERENAQDLNDLLLSLPGKSGPDICACYRQMAKLGTDLDDRNIDGKAHTMSLHTLDSCGKVYSFSASYNLKFSQTIPCLLDQAIQIHPTPDLCSLAEELHQEYGALWTVPAGTAALLFQDTDKFYTLLQPYFYPDLESVPKKDQKDLLTLCRTILSLSFDGISWEQKTRQYEMHLSFYDPARPGLSEDLRQIKRPLHQNLGRQIYEGLLSYAATDPEYAQTLCSSLLPIPEGDSELCAYLGKKLYALALHTPKDNRFFLKPLKLCHWTTCQGLAVHFCRQQKKLTVWEITHYLEIMPGNTADKAEELKKIIRLLELGQLDMGKNFRAAAITHLKQLLDQKLSFTHRLSTLQG